MAKDLINDNNGSDLKICLKVTSMQRVLASKEEKLNSGKLLKFQEAQIFIRAYENDPEITQQKMTQ